MGTQAFVFVPFVVVQIRESLQMTTYLRRNGNMMFWRIGKVGGSFYLASSARQNDQANALRRAKRTNARRELRALRREIYGYRRFLVSAY